MKNFFLLFLCFSLTCYSQVGIGIANPDGSAILDITASGNNKGLLLPRLTTAQRNTIANPAQGLTLYNTDIKCLQVYDQSLTRWENVCPAAVFKPEFLGFLTNDVTLTTGNTRYNIPFNQIEFSNFSSGSSYNSTTGGVTLIPGLYEITYSLVGLLDATGAATPGFQNDPNTADMFIAAFENATGNTAGTEIQGTGVGVLLGATPASTYSAIITNTFYIRVASTQIYYLKAKTYNMGVGIISTNQVFQGSASYNKPHLNNFLSIKKLILP